MKKNILIILFTNPLLYISFHALTVNTLYIRHYRLKHQNLFPCESLYLQKTLKSNYLSQRYGQITHGDYWRISEINHGYAQQKKPGRDEHAPFSPFHTQQLRGNFISPLPFGDNHSLLWTRRLML